MNVRRFGWALPFLVLSGGCSIAPKSFRGIDNPAPLVRARAAGLGRGLPDQQVIPALVDKLSDPDPVVRLTSHEELKKRTGKDFGFVPWDDPAPRARAVERWKAWLAGRWAGVVKRRRRP